MRKRTWWLAVVAIWVGLAVTSATQASVRMAARGQPEPFGRLLRDSLIDWGTCAVFTPVILWLVIRFPAVRRPLAHVPVLLAAIAVLVVAKFALQLGLLDLVGDQTRAPLGQTVQMYFAGEAIAMGAVFAVAHAVLLHDRLRAEEVRGLALRAELADARLDALVNKIEPHFLFNTLQAVSTLLHRDPRAADTMLSRLSDLLRDLLRSDARQEVALSVELENARRYLDIMSIRYGDRLTVSIEIAAEVEAALVPRLVLQPLLENALRHGVARRAGPGRLALSALRAGDRIEIAVADDGPGPDGSSAGNGVGLTSTRERLRRLYGEDGRVEAGRPPEGGFRVLLQLPFREAA
ncbi:MAG TPA: histidine kinase [Kofleriaceae bacterium]|nr:histidine kinase [Kofleriaceae bacterium]